MRSTALHTKLLALLGIAALFVQINAVPLDYMLFRVNQANIAHNLCEHKTPNCDGHCFLMKQMASATNAAKDKNSERIGGPLDRHFLPTALNNLTLFPSQSNFFMEPAHNIAAGWYSIPHEPPRAWIAFTSSTA